MSRGTGPEEGPREGRGQPYADLRETHSGVVVLLGDTALKFKKPVDLGFLDYTTPERRLAACRREVVLNRRFAPDVYRGVGTITDEHGTVVDHVVVMRRLPEDRRLATLVRAGADVDTHLRDIARRLAAWHAAAQAVRGPGTVTTASLSQLWRSAVDVARQWPDVVPPSVVDDVERLAGRYLEGRGEVFERRVAEGDVVDGHGDLMAEDIFCLADGPRVLDCLEFDDRLRTLDRIDDAAFLAMDLERLGAPDAGGRFLDRYREFSDDTAPDSLVDHYLAYRSFVRAKVACLRYGQHGAGALGEAARCASMTLAHLQRARVTLVLVGGAPGTGKSTVAAGLADELGLVLLSSDRVRKELAGLAPERSHGHGFEQGLYSPQWTERVYDELLARARRLLARGESVVVDATWARPELRAAALRVAAEQVADPVELRCRLDLTEASGRVQGRGSSASAAGTVSDMTPELLQESWETFQPWPGAAEVDTSRDRGAALAEAVGRVRPPDTRAVRSRLSRMAPG